MSGSPPPEDARADPAPARPLDSNAPPHFAGWEIDLPAGSTWWSAQALALLDLPSSARPGVDQAIAMAAPESRAVLHELFERCARDGAPWEATVDLTTARGRRIRVQASGRAVRMPDGELVRIQVAFREAAAAGHHEDDPARLVARLANTLDTMSEAVLTLDSAMRFTYLNPAAEALVRRTSADLVGKLIWDEFPGAIGGPSYREYGRALRERRATSFEEYFAPLRTWFEPRCYPIDDGLALYFHDITERKEARLALNKAHRALQMLSRCNHMVVHAARERDLIAEICRIAVEVGGYRMAWVGYAEHDAAKSISIAAHSGNPDEVACLRQRTFGWSAETESGRGPAGAAIRSGAPVVVEEIARDGRFSSWFAVELACGYGGAIYLPLKDGARAFGVLTLYTREVAESDADETRLLQELADNLAFGITAVRMRFEQDKMHTSLRTQASLLDKAQDAIIVRDLDDRIEYWNKSAERMYGWRRDEVLGQKVDMLLHDDMEKFRAVKDILLQTGHWNGETTRQCKNGSVLTVQVALSLIAGDDGKPEGILSINTDISARKAAEREIERLAFYDPVTSLPNRLLLLDRLQHALTVSGRTGAIGALLFIDLDHFKTINDTLGHEKGDHLLLQVGQRLRECVFEIDTVARFGGDEFVILLENLGKQPAEAATKARQVCERIARACAEPVNFDGFARHTTASIGVTLFDNQESAPNELLKQADLAMYEVKAAGRNGVRFFDPAMQTVVSARAALEADLREGLKNGEFLLHYQPQLNRAGAVTGAEALIRWQSARRGMVSPAAFIPAAEETGLILPMGRWVLEQACAQLARWAGDPVLSHLSISVNVSARQLRQPRFVDEVFGALDRAGAAPRRLKIEITESLLVDDTETTIATMHRLKERGVCFSLDDFGTGYSSLSYLKRLPLDQLKIDRSFISDVMTESSDAAIIRTIFALGRCLDLNVIAEGVETAAQHRFLMEQGCDAFQGYLFSQPVPAEQFEAFARKAGGAPS